MDQNISYYTPRSCFPGQLQTGLPLQAPVFRVNNLYKKILNSINLLFQKLKDLTEIGDTKRNIMEKMLKFSYRKFAIRQIKVQVGIILEDLARLYSTVDDSNAAINIQNLTKCLKKLMESWDMFFYGITLMEKDSDTTETELESQIKLFHKNSQYDTRSCSRATHEINRQLRDLLPLCKVKSFEASRQCFSQNSHSFALGALRFETKWLANTGSVPVRSFGKQGEKFAGQQTRKEPSCSHSNQKREESFDNLLRDYQEQRERERLDNSMKKSDKEECTYKNKTSAAYTTPETTTNLEAQQGPKVASKSDLDENPAKRMRGESSIEDPGNRSFTIISSETERNSKPTSQTVKERQRAPSEAFSRKRNWNTPLANMRQRQANLEARRYNFEPSQFVLEVRRTGYAIPKLSQRGNDN